jgi:hypothetical protein
MGKKTAYPTAGLVVLVVLLTILYLHASTEDAKNGVILNATPSTASYNMHIDKNERCRIEQVIRDYRGRRSLNKSHSQKIVMDTIMGAIRGGLGGAVLGGDSGIIPGMVAFGTLSGILSWARFALPIGRFVNKYDKSADIMI